MSFELEPSMDPARPITSATPSSKPRRVRITQLDGKLPNLALMRLSHFHRAAGDEIFFTRNAARGLFEGDYDVVYGSAIFTRSAQLVDRLRRDFPQAIVGGPGAFPYREYDPETFPTVERQIGVASYEHYDYSIYPDFDASLGYSTRGCRFRCSFCPVPAMEGRVRAVATLEQIWRGVGHPRKIHLLDNDFFGNPNWKALVEAMIDGDYKVCLNQGINVRVITPTIAEYVARMPYFDDNFKRRTLYTAWDSIGDEAVFMRGLRLLFDAGVKPDHVMVYTLVGFAEGETMDDIMYRIERMREMGVRPYPMPYLANGDQRHDLKMLQKWVVGGTWKTTPFSEFRIMSQTEREKQHLLNRERERQLVLI